MKGALSSRAKRREARRRVWLAATPLTMPTATEQWERSYRLKNCSTNNDTHDSPAIWRGCEQKKLLRKGSERVQHDEPRGDYGSVLQRGFVERATMISHIDFFYQTRHATHVSRSSAANNPNTELTETPEATRINFTDGPTREIDCTEFDAPNGKGYETARFLIERAMLDPDAVVVPQ